jgi:hypothetical protein
MKGKLIVSAAVASIAIIAGSVFVTKSYYPPLPFESASKREVIAKLNGSPGGELVRIAAERGYEWYIVRMEGGNAYDALKKKMTDDGWAFAEQLGAGFKFEKEGRSVMAVTRMWTGNYVICQIPAGAV